MGSKATNSNVVQAPGLAPTMMMQVPSAYKDSLEELLGTKLEQVMVAKKTSVVLCKIVAESDKKEKESSEKFKFAPLTSADDVEKSVSNQSIVFIKAGVSGNKDKGALSLFYYKDFNKLPLIAPHRKVVLLNMDIFAAAAETCFGIQKGKFKELKIV